MAVEEKEGAKEGKQTVLQGQFTVQMDTHRAEPFPKAMCK